MTESVLEVDQTMVILGSGLMLEMDKGLLKRPTLGNAIWNTDQLVRCFLACLGRQPFSAPW